MVPLVEPDIWGVCAIDGTMAVVSVDVVQKGRDDVNPGASPVGFDAVYAAERTALIRVAYLVVRNRAVAEELAQEAFIRLHEHFDEVRNPAGFLRTAVVRLGINWRNRRTMGLDRAVLAARMAEPLTGEEPVAIDETWRALGRLDPDRAAVLVLRFYEDLPYAEIGAIVGASAATVRSRTRRALADLREELER